MKHISLLRNAHTRPLVLKLLLVSLDLFGTDVVERVRGVVGLVQGALVLVALLYDAL